VTRCLTRWSWRDERGNATTEFALVAPLMLLLAVGVLQLTMALHVRATMTAAAAEGARIAALTDSDLAAGERRTRSILEGNIAGTAVRQIVATREVIEGMSVVTMQVSADLPLIGFFGPTQMYITAHALDEA
jgi:Flp pilus assembly protein TadG